MQATRTTHLINIKQEHEECKNNNTHASKNTGMNIQDRIRAPRKWHLLNQMALTVALFLTAWPTHANQTICSEKNPGHGLGDNSSTQNASKPPKRTNWETPVRAHGTQHFSTRETHAWFALATSPYRKTWEAHFQWNECRQPVTPWQIASVALWKLQS